MNRYEVVFTHNGMMTILTEVERRNFRDLKEYELPLTSFKIYDSKEQILVNGFNCRNYVELEDECRRMNDMLLYDMAINDYIN